VLDSVSTIAGLRYGRRRLPNGKSIEGTFAAIACTAPVLLFFLTPAAAVAAAVVGALAELVLPVNDNLVVPFLLALLVTAFA
jgi:dolichol kinase